MIWFAWRQFRTQSWTGIGALVAAGVVLTISGIHLAELYTDSGAAACHTNCDQVMSGFLNEADRGLSGVLYHLVTIAMYLTPPLIGAFWGAPLVTRELEAGTHRLAWNQSVSRRRWLASKLAVVSGVSMAVTGLLSLGVSIWASRVDDGQWLQPRLFGVRAIVPVAYTLFAVALGVAAGVLLRRTITAMAVTLVTYLAVMLTMAYAVRAHLMPAVSGVSPLNLGRNGIEDLMIVSGANGDRMQVVGRLNIGNGWELSNVSLTASGKVFTGPVNQQACGDFTSPKSCVDWIDTLGLRQSYSYQPSSHFWPLQWIESGVFVGLAAVLFALCFRWLRRLA